MPLVLHDLETEVVERASHFVKLVLGLDDDFIEALLDRPELLLLGERTEMALAAPVAPRAANPCVKNFPAGKGNMVLQAADEIDKLWIGLLQGDFVRHLERYRNHRAWIVGQRRIRHQDEVPAALEPP